MKELVAKTYDLILVGSGFASCFFLHEYLKRYPNGQVLVLERGDMLSHQERLERRGTLSNVYQDSFENSSKHKPWKFSLLVGGSSNCWWGNTPRFLPEDFELYSRYGVGVDWPLSYDELEPFYCEAERIMNVSGESANSLFPRSEPYPQPPHIMAAPDRFLRTHYGDRFVPAACARARVSTKNRPQCCASGVCSLCPIDAKFTILNELAYLFHDSRVTLLSNAEVNRVDYANDVATGVRFISDGSEHLAKGELIGLGANALFNPHLLQRSGFEDPVIGKGLHEQASLHLVCDLGDIDNFDGSSQVSANGYQLYIGDQRRERAACLIETSNVPNLRTEEGKWRKRFVAKFIFEDLRQPHNEVMEGADPAKPKVVFTEHSDYTHRGIRYVKDNISNLLHPLPVERIVSLTQEKTEGHIIGSAVMGNAPEESVVDRYLVHHRVRNLLVLGSSSFPTSSPSNPTLTLSALSLWAARNL